jgi:hypothetical protein
LRALQNHGTASKFLVRSYLAIFPRLDDPSDFSRRQA